MHRGTGSQGHNQSATGVLRNSREGSGVFQQRVFAPSVASTGGTCHCCNLTVIGLHSCIRK